jgi:hypothetical protein
MEALLWTELRKPKYATQVPVPAESRRMEGRATETNLGGGPVGQPFHGRTALGSGDSDPGGSVGGAEKSDGNRKERTEFERFVDEELP